LCNLMCDRENTVSIQGLSLVNVKKKMYNFGCDSR
jgi:hypothetical protein